MVVNNSQSRCKLSHRLSVFTTFVSRFTPAVMVATPAKVRTGTVVELIMKKEKVIESVYRIFNNLAIPHRESLSLSFE